MKIYRRNFQYQAIGVVIGILIGATSAGAGGYYFESINSSWEQNSSSYKAGYVAGTIDTITEFGADDTDAAALFSRAASCIKRMAPTSLAMYGGILRDNISDYFGYAVPTLFIDQLGNHCKSI